MMPELILTRGLPASGKTTTAERMEVATISKDKIRRAMYPTWPYAKTDLYLIQDLRDIAIDQHLEMGEAVIVDETFIEVEDINRLLEHVRGKAQVYILDLTECPFELCLLRNFARKEHRLSLEAMLDAKRRLEENTLDFLERLVYDVIVAKPSNDYNERWQSEIRERLDHYESISISPRS